MSLVVPRLRYNPGMLAMPMGFAAAVLLVLGGCAAGRDFAERGPQSAGGPQQESELDRFRRQTMRPRAEHLTAADRLPQAIQNARAAGLYVTVKDLPPPPPSQLNGALIAFPPQPDRLGTGVEPEAERFREAWSDDPASLNLESDAWLARIERGLSMPAWHIARDWSMGPYVFFPDLALMKTAAYAFRRRAEMRAEKGRLTEALADVRRIAHLSEAAASEPHPTAWLIGKSIQAIGLEAVRDLHAKGIELGQLRKSLAAFQPLSAEAAYRGDLLIVLAVARNYGVFGGASKLAFSDVGMTMEANLAVENGAVFSASETPASREGQAMAALALELFIAEGPPSPEALDRVREGKDSKIWDEIKAGNFLANCILAVLGGESVHAEAAQKATARRAEIAALLEKPPAR